MKAEWLTTNGRTGALEVEGHVNEDGEVGDSSMESLFNVPDLKDEPHFEVRFIDGTTMTTIVVDEDEGYYVKPTGSEFGLWDYSGDEPVKCSGIMKIESEKDQ